jgi:hypothetical protein
MKSMSYESRVTGRWSRVMSCEFRVCGGRRGRLPRIFTVYVGAPGGMATTNIRDLRSRWAERCSAPAKNL